MKQNIVSHNNWTILKDKEHIHRLALFIVNNPTQSAEKYGTWAAAGVFAYTRRCSAVSLCTNIAVVEGCDLCAFSINVLLKIYV